MTDSYANLSKVNAEVAEQMRNMAEIRAIAALRDLKRTGKPAGNVIILAQLAGR